MEVNIPLFKGENEKYADLFEFIDLPGLNEGSDSKKDNEQIEKNFYFNELIPIIQSNIKFAIFLFNADGYRSNDAKNIISQFKVSFNLDFKLEEFKKQYEKDKKQFENLLEKWNKNEEERQQKIGEEIEKKKQEFEEKKKKEKKKHISFLEKK